MAAALDVANLQILMTILMPLVGASLILMPPLSLVILFALAMIVPAAAYSFGIIGAWCAMRGRVWRYPRLFTFVK